MTKVKFSGAFITMTAAVGLLFSSLNVQAQTENKQDSVTVLETKACQNLATLLETEFRDNTKPLKDNPSVWLYGLQGKEAIKKAINLCIKKLKAEQINAPGEDLTYKLPGMQGTITIQEEENEDGIFLQLTFSTDCRKLPFNELWFVSMKKYIQR